MSEYTRRTKRLENDTKVRFRVEDVGDMVDATISNVSSGGVFIASNDDLKMGTTLQLSFSVESSFEDIKARGKIVWKGSQGGSKGFGVQFVEIDPIQLYDLMRGIKEGGWLYALGVLSDD